MRAEGGYNPANIEEVITMCKTLRKYDSFNFRRYSNPWVAQVAPDGKIDFKARVGGYTGRYNGGEAGSLYVTDPAEGVIYAYGQKDYRNPKYTQVQYTIYRNGDWEPINKQDLPMYL